MNRGTAFPPRLQVCPAKTQISLHICIGWSESSLFAWRYIVSLALFRLIRVFAGRTCNLVENTVSWLKWQLTCSGQLEVHQSPLVLIEHSSRSQLDSMHCRGSLCQASSHSGSGEQCVIPSLLPKIFNLYHSVDISQRAQNVKLTSYQRRCDVITSHRRWYDVILMLCACWDGFSRWRLIIFFFFFPRI